MYVSTGCTAGKADEMFEMLMAYVYAVSKDADRLRRINHTPKHSRTRRRTYKKKVQK